MYITSTRYIVVLTNNNNIINNNMKTMIWILIIVLIIWKLLQILSDSSENVLSTYLNKHNDISVHIYNTDIKKQWNSYVHYKVSFELKVKDTW